MTTRLFTRISLSLMTINDVGIITLPGGAGHVAISVFVKSSAKDGPVRERAIAEVTRTLYDYFLFNSYQTGPAAVKQ